MSPPVPASEEDPSAGVQLRSGAAPFVGRRDELRDLDRVLRATIAGRPHVELLWGDAGIGKTRLVREFEQAAHGAGMRVCIGHSLEDVSLPYLAFVEALRARLEAAVEEPGLDLGHDATVLEGFVRPSAPRPAAPREWAMEGDHDRLELFLAVSRSLVALARSRPTLLVLEDLHWADNPTLDLLAHVIFALSDVAPREQVPLLLLGTHRAPEPEDRLSRAIARFQREPICRSLELRGLEESDARELIGELGLRRPTHELVRKVMLSTAGNPLFIRELLHHLADRGLFVDKGGSVSTDESSPTLELPDDVTHAIARRARGVSEACHRVLTLAAFLGERFDLGVLEELADIGEDEALELLEEAIRQRLLRTEREHFRFDHPLVRHVFTHEPAPARRQRIHQRIAEVLEKHHADAIDEHILEIAHHAESAGGRMDPGRVLEIARRAAERASALFAWAEASRFFVAAVKASEQIEGFPIAERGELHYRAGIAYNHDWDPGPCVDQYEKAVAAFDAAGDLVGVARALKERLRAQYTLISVAHGTLPDTEPLEDVLERLGDDEPVLRGLVMETMSEAYWNARQPERAAEMARRALEIGERLRDDHLRNHASFGLGLAHISQLEVNEALECWTGSLGYVRQAGDVWGENLPLQRIPMALHFLGRLDDAESVAIHGYEHCRKTNNLGELSLALANLATVALVRGDFESCERHAQESMTMMRRSRYPWSGPVALPALAASRALRGAWFDARDAIELIGTPGRVFEEPGVAMQILAAVYRELLDAQARPEEGDTQDTINLANAVKLAGADANALGLLCALVEIADLRGSPRLAQQARPTLELAVEREVVFTNGWVSLIPRVLGVAATLRRDWDDAESWFDAAIRYATEARAKVELARTCLDYARMLAGRAGDRDLAIAPELAQRARMMFAELGMTPFARRAATLARDLGAEVPEPESEPELRPDDLGRHELAILRRLGRGQAPEEIAEALVVSEHTLADHLETICSKIGVRDPLDAARYAVDRGLVVRDGDARPASLVLLVSDIADFTRLTRRLGDVPARRVIHDHNRLIRRCLRLHHGRETIHTGDGIMGSFRSASDAIACAVLIQREFARYNREHPETPIPVRIGLNAGELLPEEDRVFGIAVNLAVRVCGQARPGEILLTDVVRQLASGASFRMRDRGSAQLKGFEETFPLFEVDWAEAAGG